MNIKLVKGIGHGATKLSAFDAALQDAGVSNYNLIVLSSVIPPHAVIERVEKYETPYEEWGHKLYVIKAEERSDIKGEALAAGLGCIQLEDGRGLFVEHESVGIDEEAVKEKVAADIVASLRDLCSFRNLHFDESKIDMEISSIVVEDTPTCVLTLAVYESEGWNN